MLGRTGTRLLRLRGIALSIMRVPRLQLSKAKHRSLAGHARIAKFVASLVPYYSYTEAEFFSVDAAPADIVAMRRAALEGLSELYRTRFAKTAAVTAEAMGGMSDLQFTAAYRVPFQFRSVLGRHFEPSAFLASADGNQVTDLDGNSLYDLTGSYGVNVLGSQFYKDAIRRGAERVQALGPVLGTYHPVVVDNVNRLKALSGLDEVSFHMSGTEAIMQAVRLARYHTRRPRIVRFVGAYHGWWGDVQPGIGNPMPAGDTFTLKDLSEDSLRVLQTRRDIACVLVNPLQALHPNTNAPADSALIDSARWASFDKNAYATWLGKLRAVCTDRNIVLIVDEVFVGFRLARGGAQEYFGIRADLVAYGKTLGGGLPVGVVCGRKELMQRYRPDRPIDICFARGTFNSHPYVMGAMNEFLRFLDTPEARALYRDLDRLWNDRAGRLNERLEREGLPVRVVNLSSIWTVIYTRPSRYNWMLQYYLRAHGLALSWVGTGRLIFSLAFTDQDFSAVGDRFVTAARAMHEDGWWWHDGTATDRSIKRRMVREMIGQRFPLTRNHLLRRQKG